MTLGIALALKVSALILAALGAGACMRTRSAAARHWVLAVAIACALALPLVGFVVPAWPIGAVTAAPPAGPSVTETISFEITPTAVAPAPSTARSVTSIAAPSWLLGSIWLAGVLASGGLLGLGVWRLRRLTSRAQAADATWRETAERIARAYGLRRPVRVLQTDHPSLLVAVGLLRPTVLLPAGAHHWSDERRRIVMGHELAHIARRDWAIYWLGELLRAACWFNPLVWIACRRLRLESERACDDEVLRLGVGGTDYATHLVDLARDLTNRRSPYVPALAIARPSTLRQRIKAMLNDQMNRTPPTRFARALTIAALVAATFPLAALGAQSFASLQGTIVDASGGLVPDARITLSNPAASSRYEVTSNRVGAFQFVGLPPGTYVLQVERVAFTTLRREITLTAGETRRETVGLDLGTLQETVSVTNPATASEPASPRVRTAPANRPARACTPEPVGGRVVPPLKIKDVRPNWPSTLQGANAPIEVRLAARIGVDGIVNDVRVLSSTTSPDAEAAAADAVAQWRFTPTLLNCVPTEVTMNVSVTFRP